MTDILMPATPLFGHVTPVVAIGAGLRTRGHRVTVLTGHCHRAMVEAAGLRFLALPEAADITRLPPVPRPRRRPRVLVGRDAVLDTFVRPLCAQHEALVRAVEEVAAEAVVSDTAFLGALPLLRSAPPGGRIPVLGISATPLSLVSVDCAPFGSGLAPGTTEGSRRRNQRITWLLRHGPLRGLHAGLDAALARYGVPARSLDYFDHAAAFDRTFQLGSPGSEYPRRDLPDTVRFVGPPRGPAPAPATPVPDWWRDLDDGRPVVHVTQGTMANTDPAQLILPAVRGLAGAGVWVVVSTGGRPVAELAERLGAALPAHVRLADFLPYHRLLPRTAVMVTNGGYGGVQLALRHGVPLVVAGATEDKPEVGARIAWSGSGLHLRTGRPGPRRLARAVRRLLSEPGYRERAQELAAEIAALGDPAEAIDAELRARTGQPAGGDPVPTAVLRAARPGGPGSPGRSPSGTRPG